MGAELTRVIKILTAGKQGNNLCQPCHQQHLVPFKQTVISVLSRLREHFNQNYQRKSELSVGN